MFAHSVVLCECRHHFQLLMVVSAAQHHAAFSVEHKIKLENIRTYLETLSPQPAVPIEKQEVHID